MNRGPVCTKKYLAKRIARTDAIKVAPGPVVAPLPNAESHNCTTGKVAWELGAGFWLCVKCGKWWRPDERGSVRINRDGTIWSKHDAQD